MKKLYHVELTKRMYVLAENEKEAIQVGRRGCTMIDLAEDESVRVVYHDEGINEEWKGYPPFEAETNKPNTLTVEEIVEKMKTDIEARQGNLELEAK